MVKVSFAGGAKHRVLVTRRLSDPALDRLISFFEIYQCTQDEVSTPEQLKKHLQYKAGALIGERDELNARVIEGLSQLKAVCSISSDTRNLDLPALTNAGIFAMNVPTGADQDDLAAAESLIAAFGFGRMGGRPPNLLNPELLCDCC